MKKLNVKRKRLVIFFFGLMVPAAIAAGALPLMLSRPSNCGGNSAALSDCKMCVLSLRLAADEQGETFPLQNLSASEKTEVTKICHDHWIPEAGFLIKTNISIAPLPKQVIVVCTSAYGNVPQPTFWNGYRQTLAYAVGYSDGSVDLISPAQFKQLKLSEFIEVATLGKDSVSTLANNRNQ